MGAEFWRGWNLGRSRGLGGATFKRGVEPLLRACGEGERQPWKGGPLESGVPGFGGRALRKGVWVGFGPSTLEGVSECRGGALGGGVGAGLGFCGAGGRLRGQRIRPRSPTGSPVPKWTGKVLAPFPSVPSCPSPTVSPRVPPIAAGPLTMGGSHWV